MAVTTTVTPTRATTADPLGYWIAPTVVGAPPQWGDASDATYVDITADSTNYAAATTRFPATDMGTEDPTRWEVQVRGQSLSGSSGRWRIYLHNADFSWYIYVIATSDQFFTDAISVRTIAQDVASPDSFSLRSYLAGDNLYLTVLSDQVSGFPEDGWSNRVHEVSLILSTPAPPPPPPAPPPADYTRDTAGGLVVTQSQYIRDLDFTSALTYYQGTALVPISGDRMALSAHYQYQRTSTDTDAQVWTFVYQANADHTFTELSATKMHDYVATGNAAGFDLENQSMNESSVRIGTTDRILTVDDRGNDRHWHLVDVGADHIPRLVTTLVVTNVDKFIAMWPVGADSVLLLAYDTFGSAGPFLYRATITGDTITVSPRVDLALGAGINQDYVISGDTLILVRNRNVGSPYYRDVVLVDIPTMTVRQTLLDINNGHVDAKAWDTTVNLSEPLPDGRVLLSLNLTWHEDGNMVAYNRHLMLLDPATGTLTDIPATQWPPYVDAATRSANNFNGISPFNDPVWEEANKFVHTKQTHLKVIPHGTTTVLVQAALGWEQFRDNTYGVFIYDWNTDELVGNSWLPVWPTMRLTREQNNAGGVNYLYALWPVRTSPSGRLMLWSSEYYDPSNASGWYQNLYLASLARPAITGGLVMNRRAFKG